jgi:hypothetical protein
MLAARRFAFFALMTGTPGIALAQPLILPGARLPDGSVPRGSTASPGVRDNREAATPVPKATAAKPISEEMVLNRDLKLNGSTGLLRIERSGGDLRAKLTLSGVRRANPGEACEVAVGGGDFFGLVSEGRPNGVPRYELTAGSCPISLDMLDGAVVVGNMPDACTPSSDCRVDPRGMWGPEPGTLIPQARTIEQSRTAAEKAVRDNYRVLTARAKPGESRTIITEQAAFSSERETLCRNYAREAAHGFCGARFTEYRSATLAARLGVTATPTPTANATPRRRRTAPAPEPEVVPQ